MVDSISSNFVGATGNAYVGAGATHYISNTAKKAADVAEDTFSSSIKDSTKSAAIFQGLPLARFFKNNKVLKNNPLLTDLTKVNKEALENLLHGKDKVSKRVLDFVKTTNKSNKAFSEVRSATNTAAKLTKAEAKLAQATEKGLSDKAITKLETKISKLTTKSAEKAAAAEAGVKVAAEAGGKVAGKLGKLLKSTGAGFMLALSGITEMASEVIPTFKELGKEKGLKQLGKSTIKVLADTAGFVGGEYAGTALGTAIGTAICPGIGSAVGAVIGFIGGLTGSFIAGKVTKAVVGESEREIAKKAQEAQANKQNIFSTVA